MLSSVSRELLDEEVGLAIKVLTKWREKLSGGIPGVDLPASDYDADLFEEQLCGELFLLSGKLERLAQLLGNTGGVG